MKKNKRELEVQELPLDKPVKVEKIRHKTSSELLKEYYQLIKEHLGEEHNIE